MRPVELETTIEAAQQGNIRAFEKLYIDYRVRVLRFLILKGVPKNDAEELCNDVFIAIWSKLHIFQVSPTE